MVNDERQGVYAASLMDWLTFRRTFLLHTKATPEAIERYLASISQPPPMDPSPFSVSVTVAVAHTIAHTGLFEVHVMRGLPWGGHYTSLLATGRVAKKEQEHGAIISGEIHTSQSGLTIYTGIIIIMMLWVMATVVSSIANPVVTLVPAFVAVFSAMIAVVVIYTLLIMDMRRLTRTIVDLGE
ncbi:MAG: hypothetical protein AAF787_09790 [Chloroflexota bacterium]